MTFVLGAVFAGLLLCFIFIIRLYAVVKTGHKSKPGAKGPVAVLVVAGSGGHTTEILRLMESLSSSYTPRHYVIADTDRMSQEKVCTFESSKQQSDSETQFTIHRIPRSREVRQSLSSSVVSTLNALQYSLPLVFRLRPDMVLCNGPGTCVPLCAAALLLGILGMKKVVIVYVESICRVQTLSLTGMILYPISDYFFVQWSSLRDKYPKSIFLGRIV
ncbi:UDP-N-acetylglucosamine transferase subunit ALG14 homolog [Acanthochromis polyacanthus]|uniref:UDP-N-acetylglucosamine transferase subunit ALG14 n=1 Tax=Acanthochromis polyacanthus TaxID=80966 RepID=A0A3Q1EN28_9TELE|nr:UDP-N-acetylglucosamine transferase subunit ALG14 homolog [Acanthochromis polyacanthus]